jgi:hypothetical protein
MFELQSFTSEQIQRLANTISSNAFYMIVGNALIARKALSVVRMGDGEAYLSRVCESQPDGYILGGAKGRYDEDWLKALGCFMIPKSLLRQRLREAAEESTYFAPSITGIFRPEYDNYELSFRERYVDNFFVNDWTKAMKVALFSEARHVLLIHRNAETADALQINLKNKLGVKVTFIPLSGWEETDKVISRAAHDAAPLVLFSAGPAGKYMAPRIAEQGKVVLDIGNSIDSWTMTED